MTGSYSVRLILRTPERAEALRSYAWLLVDSGRFNRAGMIDADAQRNPIVDHRVE